MPDTAPLRQQLAGLPTGPGVYIYRDSRDRVLYVGKAKSIRKRVLSYFQAPLRPDDVTQRAMAMSARAGMHPKVTDLVERIASVETFVTGSESEALILEANLVKRHRPPFNVRLRDDKSYPYIGISLDEDYPRVYFTRERHRRDRLYFGPFSNAYKVRDTLSLIGKIFPSRPCEGPEPGRPSGIPCLDYHIKRCLAPCVGYISKEDYRALIDQIVAFLSGRYRGLERELEADMRAAAAAQEFERAAALRNRLEAVRHLMERQLATAGSVGTADVLGIAIEDDAANVQVLQVRDGVMQDRQSFFLETSGDDDEAAVLLQFAYEYYAMALAIPPLVIVAQESESAEALASLLSERRGSGVEVRASARGDKRKLAELAARNARFALDQDRRRHEQARGRRREALAELQDRLELPALPARIECYDISNLGETYSVASMVVFEGGAPARGHYRTFTMRYDGGPDDFARMEEALRRRFSRLAEPGEEDVSFAARPGLVVIDGGKGQLGAALAGMREAGVDDVPVVSLAKRREEVFRPGRSEPLLLDEGSAGLRLLQHVRDEAHRFALRHHRGRRGRGMTESVLDALPGVGPARKAAILRHFGSVDRFLSATREELEGVPGVPPKVAREVYDHLHKTAGPREDGATVAGAPAGGRVPGVELTIITGMSGAGKSQAMGAFEDFGWFCVDNLPPRLLPALADLFLLEGSRVERAAVVCDVRGGVWFKDLEPVLERVSEARGVRPRVVFLEASDETLINRFRETRRRHPLSDGGSVSEGIERERAELAVARARADVVIDTTGLSIWDLRRRVAEALMAPGEGHRMTVQFVSFGYKHGVPRDADLVIDVRFLRNPHYVAELRPLTGLDAPVADYVMAAPGMDEFRARLEALLDFLLPAYAQEGKTSLVVGIGCTGGRHRSVTIAELLARRYADGFDASTSHRHVDRPSIAPDSSAQ